MCARFVLLGTVQQNSKIGANRELQIIRKGRSKLAGQERKKDTKMTEELMSPSEHDTL